MKILIAYYSRRGSTEKLAKVFKENFENKGHSVDVEKIKPIKEHDFIGWLFIRVFIGVKFAFPGKCKNPSLKRHF